ncbi:MAG: hypothetical protein E6H00_09365 [Bacillati bacterium ANGP1]|uniref:Uncharacterized protein n=1 Tax=Candidatus Segetimicrobium genomatis TaxID=2569760 RepID=A0A537K1A0_9BACT|nr:MAG: hypothetical protein E6H00_09365 [Terrabacteria group bacterium ANGP1]
MRPLWESLYAHERDSEVLSLPQRNDEESEADCQPPPPVSPKTRTETYAQAERWASPSVTQVPLNGGVEGVFNLPAAFGMTFFIRFFIPGILVSLASIPLWPPSWTAHLDISGLAIYLFGSFALGIILRASFLLLTTVFLGWTFPRWIRNWLIRRLQRRLDWAQKIMAEPFPPTHSSLDALFWDKMRASAFIRTMPCIPVQVSVPGHPPAVQLRPTVTLPTVWGNIWTAFSFDMGRCFGEAPSRRFGYPVHAISRAFYAISTVARHELEELISYSESAFTVSVGLVALVLAYVWAALHAGWTPILRGHVVNLVMVGVSLLGTYLTYSISVSQLSNALESFRAAVLKEHPEPTPSSPS